MPKSCAGPLTVLVDNALSDKVTWPLRTWDEETTCFKNQSEKIRVGIWIGQLKEKHMFPLRWAKRKDDDYMLFFSNEPNPWHDTWVETFWQAADIIMESDTGFQITQIDCPAY